FEVAATHGHAGELELVSEPGQCLLQLRRSGQKWILHLTPWGAVRVPAHHIESDRSLVGDQPGALQALDLTTSLVALGLPGQSGVGPGHVRVRASEVGSHEPTAGVTAPLTLELRLLSTEER